MQKCITCILIMLVAFLTFSACGNPENQDMQELVTGTAEISDTRTAEEGISESEHKPSDTTEIKLTFGNEIVFAAVDNSETTQAFLELLPLTLSMNRYGDREYYGNLVVNEEQAKIVREIYGLFLQGRSPYQIAKILTEKGIPTPGGKKVWGKAVVESILTNEKYKGDALLQKVYTTDFLSKKKKKNEGEVPQYYVEGNHEAIIPPAVFDNVQVLMQSRGRGSSRNSCVSIFSSKIRCGDCGSWYGSKVWHSNDKYRKVVWQCNHKFDGGEKCTTPHMDEETVRQLFIKVLNTINREKTRILAGFEEIRDTAFETGELEAEARQLNGEMNVAAELIQKCIGENACIAQNQGEYAKRYDALVGRFEMAKARLEEVQAAITEKQAQRKMMENFMDELWGLPEQVDYFDEAAWYAMVNFMTVYGKDDMRFTFKNGMEIKA